jgi:hypothetical protein
VSVLEIVGSVLRLVGLIVVLPGLWFSMNGLRVVVSGRIDERRRSAGSLKRGLLLLFIGAVLLIAGSFVR